MGGLQLSDEPCVRVKDKISLQHNGCNPCRSIASVSTTFETVLCQAFMMIHFEGFTRLTDKQTSRGTEDSLD